MKRHWRFAAGLLLCLAIAAALRLPRLNLRPFHGDEAVHAYKLNDLWATLRDDGSFAGYKYDPHEFHGPTLNVLTLPVAWLRGVHDYAELDAAAFRVVTVVFGLGMILLLPLVADGLGRGATLCAGLLTAISPLMVFCSRHYVQEMLLVFFTFALMSCAWRYVRGRRMIWAILAGVCAGSMHASKETCIIALGALSLALLGTHAWRRYGRGTTAPPGAMKRRRGMTAAWVLACLAAIVVSVVLFSSFFTNGRGPLDSVAAYAIYLKRGSGDTIHTHPWHYYLKMLIYTHYVRGPVWSEALIVVLALLGLVAVNRRKGLGDAHPSFVSFVAVYTLLMVVIYSALPYKTPWSMLGFVHGLILLAGLGASALLRWLQRLSFQIPAALLLLAATAQLGVQSWRTNLDPRFVADRRNPYVYAHPLRGVEMLGSFVERLADVHPDGRRMFVRVVMSNAWPVPWYLRRLETVGCWADVPEDCDAPVVIAASDTPPGPEEHLRRTLEPRLKGEYEQFTYSLRPDVRLIVYVESDLMHRFRARERAKQPPP